MDELESNDGSITKPVDTVTDVYHTRNARIRANRPGSEDTTAKILELRAKGITQKDIAEITGVSQQSIARTLKKFEKVFKNLPRVPEYRTKGVKSDLLAAGQLAALESGLSSSKLKKSSAKACIDIFDTLNKAERLENNQSTENVSNKFFGNLEVTHVTIPIGNQPVDITKETIDR